MKRLGSTLSWLIQVLIRRWFLLFTIFALYHYHITLDKDMVCSCTSLDLDCWVYLLAPGLVLFMVQLWVNLVFSRGLRLLCRGVGGPVAPVLIWQVLEAGFVGMLWVPSVLLDGDWYLCCGRGTLGCFTPGEILLPLNQIKNESQVIGLLLVVLLTLTATILSCIPCGSSDWPEAVLEEAGLVMSQRIRMATRDKLRAKMDQSGANWREWEGLERELLLGQKPAETQHVQGMVHVNPIPLRPISRQGSDMDWGRARPGLNYDQVTSKQWRK